LLLGMDFIAYAIPVFFALIIFEVGLGMCLGRRLYRFHDSVNDLSMGIISEVGGAFLGAMTFATYLFVWHHFRLMDMGATFLFDITAPWWVWVAAFVSKDFMYYWAHRMSHEMNLGWATHIAHHQSEEYNLSVALRQGVFQNLFFWIFYIPLAFIGFPPAVYLAVSAAVTLYQFWIHTRAVGKLGPIEWVFNTPSHHRVHHGRDPKYIDKNHAGVFIIWDRMFGTFKEEEEEPNYGIVTPLKSWNPLWAQVHYFVKLVKRAWQAPRPADKVKLWFMEPAWQPEGAPAAPEPETRRSSYRKYDTDVPLGLNLYAFMQFTGILLFSTGFLFSVPDLTFWQKVLGAGTVFVTVAALGAMFEARRWALYLELARLILLTAVLVAFGGSVFGIPWDGNWLMDGALVLGGAVSLYWFTRYRHLFQVRGLWVELPTVPDPEPSEESARA
ncbi:MAG: sterol desaturase family protein, partial [Candidatus Hydrogenedentes bacterium]|nr:sterol desaturase family protein [Candidatus Hydrogenedentota bacterium]